jgi:hypothetical protein
MNALFFGRLHHIDLLTQRSELTNERKKEQSYDNE